MLPALEQEVSLQGTPGVFSGMAGLNKKDEDRRWCLLNSIRTPNSEFHY